MLSWSTEGQPVGSARPDGDAAAGQEPLSLRVLTIALGLSLWIAAGSLALAVAGGPGSAPLRRALLGVTVVAFMAVLLWQRRRILELLRVWPWLVMVLGVGQLGVAVADGIIGSPYLQNSLTSIGIASVVARPRTVWACAGVLTAGCAIAILASRSPAALVDSGDLAGALGALFSYPFAALVVAGLAGLFGYFNFRAGDMLEAIRGGLAPLTPMLNDVVRFGVRGPLLLPAGLSPFSTLAEREIQVAEALAAGRRPKQIALDWGLSLPTVRKAISHAKRKTGARTLAELAAMTTLPDWPGAGV